MLVQTRLMPPGSLPGSAVDAPASRLYGRAQVQRPVSDPPAVLGQQVRAVLGLELEIEQALNWQLERASAHPELHAALVSIQHGCRTRGNDLDVYISDRDSDSAVPQSPLAPLLAQARSAEMLFAVLCVDAA